MIREQIFINAGELYKEVSIFTDEPVGNPYIQDDNGDPATPYYKLENGVKKTYQSSQAFREFNGIETELPALDLSIFDISPDIIFPVCAGFLENIDEKELYFDVPSPEMLHNVASYYNLPYPITEELGVALVTDREKLASYWNEKYDIVLGSVKFRNNIPTMLKFYVLHKAEGKWDYFNRGRVFVNGAVVEEGGWFTNRMGDVKFTSSGKGFTTVYRFKPGNEDPLIHWEGVITTASGEVIKHYESSKMVRTAVCKLTTGSNYEEYDRCPDVTWWLGKSWVDNSNEVELYFHVESKNMLDHVCKYYNLPVPYDATLAQNIDNNKNYIRYRSFDLYNLGEGSFVELLLASVTFKDGVPSLIKFYEVIRPYE